MNTVKHVELLRLVNNEPLTLACSALADFLWDDFVRDARPSVKYLSEVHNIKQLSRFGKELFDRLYNADNVNWLISEEDYEDYFRKVSDGDLAAIPEGYKPENGIWWAIMSDLSQAAAWSDLLQRSVGHQFNAGNNAINILNQLSEIIEEAIDQQQFDVELLTATGDKLKELRDKFKEAQKSGNVKAAKEAQAQGKAINKALNEAIQKARESIQPQTHGVIDSTLKNNDDTNESIDNFFGTTPGTGRDCGNLKEKRDLAKKLNQNKELRKIAKKLGALKRIWAERKRAKKTKANYESITGAKFSDDVIKAFPTEIALANTDKGKALFALKYSQKTLLTKDYTANSKNLGRGPIVLYVDVSGSMNGESEIWSKAITFVIAEQALRDKREIQIHLFDTSIQNSIELHSDRKNNKELLDFVGSWTLGGGTSFNAVIAHALDQNIVGERADVLMITDGYASIHENFKSRLNKFKKETGTQWSTICINTDIPDVCRTFSDELFSVNLYNMESTIDAIQSCIR